MPGPPPKPIDQRARRNATIAMTQLPAAGRQGPAPKWPLVDDVKLTAQRNTARASYRAGVRELDDESLTKRQRTAAERKVEKLATAVAILDAQLKAQRKLEAELWRDMWATPQSFQWEKLGWQRDVAQYVRHKVLGELGSMEDSKEARAWSDRLGLNPIAMQKLRWEVGDATPTLEVAGTTPRAATSSRARYAGLAAAQ